METDNSSGRALYRIQDYLRAAASRGRETERIGPFLATFSRSTTNPFLNYAIPDRGADPLQSDGERLIASYEVRGLRARLEYITAYAPEVEAPLLAGGFQIEGRLALMICLPGNGRQLPIPSGIELIRPATQ